MISDGDSTIVPMPCPQRCRWHLGKNASQAAVTSRRAAAHEHANEQASLDAHLLQQMQLPLQVFLVEVQHLSATITISLAS